MADGRPRKYVKETPPSPPQQFLIALWVSVAQGKGSLGGLRPLTCRYEAPTVCRCRRGLGGHIRREGPLLGRRLVPVPGKVTAAVHDKLSPEVCAPGSYPSQCLLVGLFRWKDWRRLGTQDARVCSTNLLPQPKAEGQR